MSIEAMKQALEALEKSADNFPANTQHTQSITALRTAIEQAEKQEPVAWIERWYGSGQEQGWWIWERHSLTHGQAVARIGTGPFAERLTSIIVEKHNAALFPTEPVKEPLAPDPHGGVGTPQPAAQPAPVQEPVAVVSGYYGGQCVVLPTNPARLFNSGTALYTTPPAQEFVCSTGLCHYKAQRQWVGLTDEQKSDLVTNWFAEDWAIDAAIRLLGDYDSKLREKNGGAA